MGPIPSLAVLRAAPDPRCSVDPKRSRWRGACRGAWDPWTGGSAPATGCRELLDPDRRRLELGRAGLGVRRVDRQVVGRDVVLEVERHEREARAAAPRRRGPAPRPGRAARRRAPARRRPARAARRPRARGRASRPAGAGTCSRPTGRPCCTSRGGGRSSGGSGSRRRGGRPAGRARPARTARGCPGRGPPTAASGGTARPGASSS